MKNKNNRFNLGPHWPVAFVAFYGCSLHSGCLIYAFSLFVNPLQTAFGWDRTAIMTAFTLQLVCLGLVSPLVGRLVDHYGARRIVSLGALTAALGFVLLPFIKSLAMFYAGNIIAGLGSAAMGPVPLSAAVTERFDEKRGVAVGIMSTGIGVGGFVAAPLIGGLLLPSFGWKISYAAIAVVTLTMIPPALLFLAAKPGQDERHFDDRAMEKAAGNGAAVREELLSTPFFLIAAGFFLFLFSIVGMLQSQVPHLRDIGFPLPAASSILGVAALVSAGAKFSFGLLCDRFHPRAMFVAGALFLAGGILLLRRITPDASPTLIWTYAVVLGIGVGSWLPIMSMMVGTAFKLTFYGTIFGAMSMVQQIGTATGPLAAGVIFDKTGNYQGAFNLYLAATLCAMIAIIASGFDLKKKSAVSTPVEKITG